MVRTLIRRLAPAPLLAAALAAQAEPDPLDAKAPIPSLRYESSFAQYRRLDDQKLISWREANDTVSRIGGWRVYAREAQQPEPAQDAPKTPAPKAPGVSR